MEDENAPLDGIDPQADALPDEAADVCDDLYECAGDPPPLDEIVRFHPHDAAILAALRGDADALDPG